MLRPEKHVHLNRELTAGRGQPIQNRLAVLASPRTYDDIVINDRYGCCAGVPVIVRRAGSADRQNDRSSTDTSHWCRAYDFPCPTSGTAAHSHEAVGACRSSAPRGRRDAHGSGDKVSLRVLGLLFTLRQRQRPRTLAHGRLPPATNIHGVRRPGSRKAQSGGESDVSRPQRRHRAAPATAPAGLGLQRDASAGVGVPEAGALPRRGGSAALAGDDAIRVVDAVDALDGAEHRVEVVRVAELELEAHLRHPVGAGDRRRREDVGVAVR